MEQLVMNLAINAADAMPDGGTLTIATRRTDDQVRLEVEDTGTGMDETTRLRIFEPFFTTKEPGRGTGLGLATVYGIVQQSGGDIEVQSALGQGTRFVVRLPAIEPLPSDVPARSPTAQAEGSAETILLVEDEEAVRRGLERLLRLHGYRVLSASNAEAALDVVRHRDEPIPVLLTDVVMPGMNGRELASRLEAMGERMRVVFMSGYANDPELEALVRSGRAAFLQKPFALDALLGALRVACNQAASSLDEAEREEASRS